MLGKLTLYTDYLVRQFETTFNDRVVTPEANENYVGRANECTLNSLQIRAT